MAAIPNEHVGVPLVAVAGQAGRHTVFGDAQAAAALGQYVINRFRALAAVNAALVGELMQRLSPASHPQLWAQVL